MLRLTSLFAFLFILAGSAGIAQAQQDDRSLCFSTNSDAYKQDTFIQTGLDACTREINSGKHNGQTLAYYYRGRAYWYNRQGDLQRALEDFNRAADLDPRHHETYDYRGDVYFKLGNDERALWDFEQAIRLRPNYAAAYYRRGEVYRRRGETDKALADYRKCVSLPTPDRIAKWAQDSARDRLREMGAN